MSCIASPHSLLLWEGQQQRIQVLENQLSYVLIELHKLSSKLLFLAIRVEGEPEDEAKQAQMSRDTCSREQIYTTEEVKSSSLDDANSKICNLEERESIGISQLLQMSTQVSNQTNVNMSEESKTTDVREQPIDSLEKNTNTIEKVEECNVKKARHSNESSETFFMQTKPNSTPNSTEFESRSNVTEIADNGRKRAILEQWRIERQLAKASAAEVTTAKMDDAKTVVAEMADDKHESDTAASVVENSNGDELSVLLLKKLSKSPFSTDADTETSTSSINPAATAVVIAKASHSLLPQEKQHRHSLSPPIQNLNTTKLKSEIRLTSFSQQHSQQFESQQQPNKKRRQDVSDEDQEKTKQDDESKCSSSHSIERLSNGEKKEYFSQQTILSDTLPCNVLGNEISEENSGSESDEESVGKKSTLKDNWEQMFREVVEYYKNYGHCNVPPHFPSNPTLGAWCIMQRSDYASRNKGYITPLTSEKIDMLNSIGFSFPLIRSERSSWRHMFDQLKIYKEKYGDCLVPQSFPDQPKLGRWVDKQRHWYKCMNQGKRVSLTQVQIKEMESIGFVWSVHKQQNWTEMFHELKEYYELHGNCLVSSQYKENAKLGRWVSQQRHHYKRWFAGKSSPMNKDTRRIQKLKELNFEFTVNTGQPQS